MFGKIAAFEFRYQLKNPVFWIGAGLFFLLAFGSVASDNVQIGASANVHVNSPFALAINHFVWSMIFMFVSTAFVANVVVRDDDTGYAPILRSTRVHKFDYLYGRFLGAFLAAALAFLAVPLAFIVGSAMPWVDPEKVGPFLPVAYAYAYFVLALPTLFIQRHLLRRGHRHPFNELDLRLRGRFPGALLHHQRPVGADAGARRGGFPRPVRRPRLRPGDPVLDRD